MPLSELRHHRANYAQLLAELATRPSHAYLFTGPRGVGKELVAEALTHSLLCERSPGADFCCTPNRCPMRAQSAGGRRGAHGTQPPPSCECCAACVQVALRVHPDFNHIARPANRTDVLIEQVRDLIAKLGIKPARAPMRIAIIDDADTLNIPAQNALLKTLEEPPGHAIIFLVAGNERALLDTARSRLRAVRFGPLSAADIAAILSLKAGLAADAADAIARLARGSAARALAMVDGDKPPAQQLLTALKGARLIDFAQANTLAQNFFNGRDDAAANFELLARLLEEVLCHKLLNARIESAAPELGALTVELAATFSLDAILIAMKQAVAAAGAIDAMANPRLQAENWWMAVGEALRGE